MTNILDNIIHGDCVGDSGCSHALNASCSVWMIYSTALLSSHAIGNLKKMPSNYNNED